MPIVQIDITARTVKNNVLFQVLDTAVNKDVSLVNPGVTFLLGAILNKWASYFLKAEKTLQSVYVFLNIIFLDKKKLIINLTDHHASELSWTFEVNMSILRTCCFS